MMVVLDWSRLIWAENQNNFDNSNNSLVCFKASDTFPRNVTLLWEYLRQAVSKLSFYLKYPETTKYFTTSLWKSVAIGFDGIEFNVCGNIESVGGCSRIGDQLGSLMAKSGSGLIAAIEEDVVSSISSCEFSPKFIHILLSSILSMSIMIIIYTVIDNHHIRIQTLSSGPST